MEIENIFEKENRQEHNSSSNSQNSTINDKDSVVKDNSWKRLFYILFRRFSFFVYKMIPYSYFILISYFGTMTGNKIFNRYIRPKLVQ